MWYGKIIDDSLFAKKSNSPVLFTKTSKILKAFFLQVRCCWWSCTSRTTRMSLCFTVKHHSHNSELTFQCYLGQICSDQTAGWSPNKHGWFRNRESTQDPRKNSGLGIITEAEGWYREACATNASALVGRTFWGLYGALSISFQNHWQSLVLKQMEHDFWLDSFEMEGATSNSLSFFFKKNSQFAWCVGCQLVAVFGSWQLAGQRASTQAPMWRRWAISCMTWDKP